MKKIIDSFTKRVEQFFDKFELGLRTKLVIIFLLVKIIPLLIIVLIAWNQFGVLGEMLRRISIRDSADALNSSAVENIERMTTDTAQKVADFLYGRDADIAYLSKIEKTEENYRSFIESKLGRIIKKGEWEIAPDGKSWNRVKTPDMLESETETKALEIIWDIFIQQGIAQQQQSLVRELDEKQREELHELGLTDEKIDELINISSNKENDDIDHGASFHYRLPDNFEYEYIPLYDEITYIDLDGNEIIKIVSDSSPKTNYPMSRELKNVSVRENTYVKAETYFDELKKLKPGEIYVSDVIGAYVGSNYIGMYAPEILKNLPENPASGAPHPNREYLVGIGGKPVDEFVKEAETQAFAGKENPNGQRFEGIVRWATPVTDENGDITGYITAALNHDHIMEFVDHITPMDSRYAELTSASEGNYAFIWDYNCRSICHPRHNSIVGVDPETGNPQVPWLETSIYNEWQESGVTNWFDFVKNNIKPFDEQSRSKPPAAALTKAGLVGLDGRYLNNAPQCTGWMDLTKNGGSGSFYIQWSGLYKLTTAAAIPYYTGRYAPSEDNGYSNRGFGFVTIGAGLEDFLHPAIKTEIALKEAINEVNMNTNIKFFLTTVSIIILVVLIAVWLAFGLTSNITNLINGISRFRAGERQFRFNTDLKDEFGTLADSFDDMADSIVASVSRPLSIIDMSHKIIYMNEYTLNLIHRTLPEVLGTSYEKNSVYPYGSEYCPITALNEERTSEIIYSEENDCYMQGVADYLFDKDNNKIGYIITSTDVTEMIQVQKKLEQAVNDANAASKHKGDFLARMSHEIRTPMNAIIGLSNIIERKLENIIEGKASDSEEIKEMKGIKTDIDHIETSSQHLLGLLNDILDITKIEAGKIDISEDETEFSKLLDAIVNIIKPRCDEKNIKFIISADSFERQIFITDSLRLRQVLINLLGNAVKFTPEFGEIEFCVRKTDRNDGKTLVEFSVSDTGVGIPEDRLAIIFEAFEQVDGKNTRQYGGAGLGLSISRTIVRMLGGDITVKSKVGEGSEFRFAIWLRESDYAPLETETLDPEGKFTDKKALLVDDVEINRMIVVSMLEITGMKIDEAEDGTDALQKFKESEEGEYDIIFMDIQMPNMDGYEATMAIRSLERADAKTVPIVALTANAFKEDMDKALANGMNTHIAKPVEMDKLIEVLFKFLND